MLEIVVDRKEIWIDVRDMATSACDTVSFSKLSILL